MAMTNARVSLIATFSICLFPANGSATDIDYGGDTLPYLLDNAKCIVWIAEQQQDSGEISGPIRVATLTVREKVSGSCSSERVQVALPAFLDVSLTKDAILFLAGPLGEAEAERYGCNATCVSAASLVSGRFGMVPYSSDRLSAVLSLLQDNGGGLSWAESILHDGPSDALLQNSAIYAFSQFDPDLSESRTQLFYRDLLAAQSINTEVKQFGLSAATLRSNASVYELLLDTAANESLPNKVRLDAFHELSYQAQPGGQLPFDSVRFQSVEENMEVLRLEMLPQLETIRRDEPEAFQFDSETDSGQRERTTPDTSLLLDVIGDTAANTAERLAALDTYASAMTELPPEDRQKIEEFRDSYELELRIHEVNLAIEQQE